MPRRLLFALLIVVAAPLALLGWLSASAYRQQQQAARQQLELFFQSRLAEIDRSLMNVFDAYERDLTNQIGKPGNPIEVLRRLEREQPIARTGMFVSNSGVLAYPPAPSSDSSDEVSLYASLPAIIKSKPELTHSDATDNTIATPTVAGQSQWQVWYMDEGIQLIFWMNRSDGAAVGILLERARWIADLTAALPDSTPVSVPPKSSRAPQKTSGFTALRDESKQLVYRWGDNGPTVDPPLAKRTLSSPLTSWQLEYHSADPLTGSASMAFVVSLAGIGVVLLGLGAYVLTGVQRQMRAARNRVSFASQVSHELRTPLTNIRLYAELAESDLARLPESETRRSIQKRLEVIDTESRRLGRLVSGVLEMIRDHRKPQGPRIAATVPDEVIDQALMQFAPSFQNAGLKVEREPGAGRVVGLDSDILEMILVNLLSNVEKYASDGDGKKVVLSSRMDGSELVVRVADQGPGISWRHRRSVFRPFSRLDNSINAPSGTGIGLTIARRLARRHGGELELVESQHGACFELRLPTRDVNESTLDACDRGES